MYLKDIWKMLIKHSKYIYSLLLLVCFNLSFRVAKGQPMEGEPVRITNPLGANTDIRIFLLKLLDVIQLIAAPIIVLAIIYAGFMFITAQGKSDKLNEAKKALLYVVIGAAVIIGAEVIGVVIENTIEEIRGEEFNF